MRRAWRVCRARRSGRAGWVRRPSSTIDRPCTTVCHADVGPQRSQASMGSARAPANVGPSRRHTATSPTAPGASTPSSPSRPRQPAPPTVAISSAIRAVPAWAPLRSFATSIAWRASSHSDAASADDDPSTPRPTFTPAARRSTVGEMPDARMRLLFGQCATPIPAAPRRRTSSGFGITQCATQVRSLHQPVRSRYSIGRHPNIASEKSSSSTFSAKWVCRRTSSRSASSAERTINSSVTLNGLQGARAMRIIAPCERSWCRATASSLAARMVSSSCTITSGGRPPSFSDRLIEPRVGWKRTPSSRAAVISAPSRSPAPRGWR